MTSPVTPSRRVASDTGPGPGPDTGPGPGSDTGPGPGSDTGTETGPDAGTETGPDAGTETDPDAAREPSGGRPDAGSVVLAAAKADTPDKAPSLTETVEAPAKVMRIGSMIKQLLEEVRQAPLDEDSRSRLRDIYETSIRELADGLSPDLAAELDRLALPFEDGTPSESALRIAQAQLVGWLEGLFHGIQATLFAQQMAARSQLEEMRRRGLPPGAQEEVLNRPGTYL